MQQEALGAVRRLQHPGPHAIERSGVCLFDASWHQGVVGLVASRVKDRLRRPVIAFACADGAMLRGSARSIAGIHIRDVLDSIAARHPELLSRFGGHAMAAGLTLERAALDRFAGVFDAQVQRCMAVLGAADAVETDGELSVAEIRRLIGNTMQGPEAARIRASLQHASPVDTRPLRVNSQIGRASCRERV